MRHPMYSHDDDIELLRLFDTYGYQYIFNHFEDEEEAKEAYNFAVTLSNIRRDGYSLIRISDDSFAEEYSKNTLMSLTAKDINLPFKAFTLQFTEKSLVVHVGRVFNNLMFFVYSKNVFTSYFVADNLSIQKVSESLHEEDEEYDVVEIVSAIMYTSMFKKEPSRVAEKTIQAKPSRKMGIPKHTINIIKLTQPEPRQLNIEGTTRKYTKKWIVRGHWRNQYYAKERLNKPKWIDPYWKGIEADEMVEKEYLI